MLEASKMEMQRELGVPFRDLMILDPNLPTAYPSSIFIRPRAVVVNLEHIKMIVVSSYALLLNTDSPEPHTRRVHGSMGDDGGEGGGGKGLLFLFLFLLYATTCRAVLYRW